MLFSFFIFSIFFESLKSKSTQILRPQKGSSGVSFNDTLLNFGLRGYIRGLGWNTFVLTQGKRGIQEEYRGVNGYVVEYRAYVKGIQGDFRWEYTWGLIGYVGGIQGNICGKGERIQGYEGGIHGNSCGKFMWVYIMVVQRE